MLCENCGNEIKENDKFCPKCGTLVKAAEDIQVTDQVTEDISENTSQSNPDPKKDFLSRLLNMKYKIPIIAGTVILLLLITGFANAASINNLIHKTFSSPESYYQFVEEKYMEEIYDLGGDIYQSFLLEYLNIYDTSVSGDFSVELSKKGEELLELAGLAGVDLSWLKSVQAQGSLSIKDSILNMGVGASLNKKNIASCDIIMDIENGNMFLQIPELTETYMGFNLKDILGSRGYRQFEEFQESQQRNKNLINTLPGEAQVEKLFKKYGNIAIKCVNNVSVDSKTLKVDGIEKNYTELKVIFDSDTFEDIMKALLEEMAEDKDIEKYILDVAEIVGEDGKDAYKEFQYYIEDLLDSLAVDDDSKIVMKVYVDGKGEVRGRTFEWEDYWSGRQSLSILTPQKGNKIGFELSVNANGNKVAFSGSGRKSGNKITGEYKLKYNGVPFFDITAKKLDIADMKKGLFNGEIGIKISPQVGNIFNLVYSGNSEYTSYMSMFTNMELKVDASSSKNSSDCKIEFIYDEEDIVTLTTSVKTGSGFHISAPNSKDTIMIEDYNDIFGWLKEIDWIKVLAHLEDTDLPDEVLDIIEDIADALEDGNIFELYRLFL